MNPTSTAKLLYADSERCADMLYLGKIFVPDPFLAIDCGDRKVAVMNTLEIARARRESAFDEVLSLTEVNEVVSKAFKKRKPSVADIVRWLMRELALERFVIPPDFPASIALELRQMRVPFAVASESLYPEREYKSKLEAEAVRRGNAASAAGFRAAERVLRASTIRKGFIIYEGKRLTSEILRMHVEQACLSRGALPAHTIVAGGDQACDPHCAGTGSLRANSLIIIDVFPRLTASGYFGDMTRTFLKGCASEAQRQLVATVREGQKRALAKIRHGVEAAQVHGAVAEYFEAQGYVTEERACVPTGFFHSTGHGLGLEVHESPRVSPQGGVLRAGMVVTVEPGLYYPGLGGCRIEDVAWVTHEGYELLSKYAYTWEIR